MYIIPVILIKIERVGGPKTSVGTHFDVMIIKSNHGYILYFGIH